MPDTPLTRAEFMEELHSIQRVAFRLEIQPRYQEPGEAEAVAAFVAGQPTPALMLPDFPGWLDLITWHTRCGRTIERVRVHNVPPNDYQRWERWLNRENHEAGEKIRYLAHYRALSVGLLPDAGPSDWWLLDDKRLIVMNFDEHGNRADTDTLITDSERIEQARAWRNLALRHGVLYDPRDAAA